MSKDIIYRQDAINALHDEIVRRRINEDTNDDGALDEFDAEVILRRLPSAHPEPKTGKWIKKIFEEKGEGYIAYTPWWYCSECGKRYEPALANTIINYCYNCGARMLEDVKGR